MTDKEELKRELNVFLPIALATVTLIMALIVLALQWLIGPVDRIYPVSFIGLITIALVSYYFLAPALVGHDFPDEWKFFDISYPDALERIEGMLTRKDIPHTMAPIDEHWFEGAQEKLGIDRSVLDFFGREKTVFILNAGAQRVLLSNAPGAKGLRSHVSIWLSSREYVQFLEALKDDIDAELAMGPS